MTSQELGQKLFNLTNALSVLDIYENKETTEDLYSYSHRTLREEKKFVDKLRISSGVLKIALTPEEFDVLGSSTEGIKIELDDQAVFNGKLHIGYHDPRMEFSFFKSIDTFEIQQGNWLEDFSKAADKIDEELKDYYAEREKAREKVEFIRVQRKLAEKREN